MNDIQIRAPRWKDRVVLVADWKIGLKNQITITCKRKDGSPFFPEPFIAWGEDLKKYPIEHKPYGDMRAVKLDDLLMTEDAKSRLNIHHHGTTRVSKTPSSKKVSAGQELAGQLKLPGTENL